MYTITKQTPTASNIIAWFKTRDGALSILDAYKNQALDNDKDNVYFSSAMGRDVRLNVDDDVYIMREQ